MTAAGILALITGVLQFPNEILQLINVLKKTPQEKHDELMKKITGEAQDFDKNGRPQWS